MESIFKKNKKNDLLETKIDEFIKWYKTNMVDGKYSDIGKYFEPKKMRYLIDNMTNWFGSRYPYYKVEKNFNLDEITKDYKEAYKSFLNLLPWDEKWILLNHKYPDIVYFDKPKGLDFRHPHFHLDSKGYIELADDLECIKELNSNNLIGMHITNAYEYLKSLNLSLNLKQIENVINDYNNFKYLKEEFLNCVMYNIIERGGNIIGPRRGLIFAYEFNKDISIPIKYGIDYSDLYLKDFISTYIKLGGNININCIIDYFYRDSDNYDFTKNNLKDIMEKINYVYVKSEQNLVNDKKVKKLVK